MTQLPTFFSEPMDMPHTYINDGNILYFCSDQENKESGDATKQDERDPNAEYMILHKVLQSSFPEI